MKRRKVWIWVVSTPLALVVAFVVWIKVVESRRWAEFEARLPGLLAEAKGRDPRRPVLRGEAVPGNAWSDYMEGVALLGEAKGSDLADYVKRMPKADRAKAEAMVQANGKALELLRAGARRAEGAYPLEIEKGVDAYLTNLRGRILVDLAVCKARFLLE